MKRRHFWRYGMHRILSYSCFRAVFFPFYIFLLLFMNIRYNYRNYKLLFFSSIYQIDEFFTYFSFFFSMNCCFTARCHQYSHLILYSLCVYSTSCTFVLLRLFWFFLSTLSTCVCGLIRLFDAPGLLNELSVWTHIHETHAHTDNNWPKNQIYEREKEKKKHLFIGQCTVYESGNKWQSKLFIESPLK